VSIWTRINPNDRDTWPRPGNLVLVSNDYGAAFNLRSFTYIDEDGGTYINAYDEHGDYDDGMETPEDLSWHPDQFARMATLERDIGHSVLSDEHGPIWLDELDPARGNHQEEPSFDCSLMCVMVEGLIGGAACPLPVGVKSAHLGVVLPLLRSELSVSETGEYG